MTRTKKRGPLKLDPNKLIPKKLVLPDTGWIPIHIGRTYCSPLCGGRCTWAAWRKATRDSDALVDRLNGGRLKGWEAIVWENLGWHWKLINRRYDLIMHLKGNEYEASLAIDEDFTAMDSRFEGCNNIPEVAVSMLTRSIRSYVNVLTNTCLKLELA